MEVFFRNRFSYSGEYDSSTKVIYSLCFIFIFALQCKNGSLVGFPARCFEEHLRKKGSCYECSFSAFNFFYSKVESQNLKSIFKELKVILPVLSLV